MQLSAAKDRINVLDNEAQLLASLPFELAFPIHHDLVDAHIDAVAFDNRSQRASRPIPAL